MRKPTSFEPAFMKEWRLLWHGVKEKFGLDIGV